MLRKRKTAILLLYDLFRVTKNGSFFKVGVWIDAGSRFENDKNNGVAHFLEHMAFKVMLLA